METCQSVVNRLSIEQDTFHCRLLKNEFSAFDMTDLLEEIKINLKWRINFIASSLRFECQFKMCILCLLSPYSVTLTPYPVTIALILLFADKQARVKYDHR